MIDKDIMKQIILEQDYKLLMQQLAEIKQLIDRLRAEKYRQIHFGVASVDEISEATGRNFNLD
jgi:predicted mannosyl-3-phosphoglycerate phosphatase (HAD superfamily)